MSGPIHNPNDPDCHCLSCVADPSRRPQPGRFHFNHFDFPNQPSPKRKKPPKPGEEALEREAKQLAKNIMTLVGVLGFIDERNRYDAPPIRDVIKKEWGKEGLEVIEAVDGCADAGDKFTYKAVNREASCGLGFALTYRGRAFLSEFKHSVWPALLSLSQNQIKRRKKKAVT
jgi:hypothetical protein